jgi:PAS domain S-box-containing protein
MVSKDPYDGLNVVDSIYARWGFDAEQQLREEEGGLTHRLLQRRERILKSVYFAAERFLREVPDDENILLVLKHLGQATEVSRVYIFDNHRADDGSLLTSQRFEWAAPGISSQMDNPDCHRFPWIEARLERWVQTLSSGAIIYGHVKDLSQAEQNLLSPQGIVSILVAPIFVGSGWWGFIGFDECRTERHWAPVEIEALKIAANIVGAAFDRKQFEEALRTSEQKYRLIIDNALEGIFVAQDGCLRFLNPKVADIIDYSVEELLDRPFIDFIHPDDRDMVIDRHLRRLRGQIPPTSYDFRVYTRSGALRWINLNVALTTWKDKPATLNFVKDITQRKRAEAELRKSEAQKQAILDASIDWVCQVDRNLRIVWCNRATAQGLQMPADDITGRPCYQVLGNRDKPCDECPTLRAFRTGKIERSVMKHQRFTGTKGQNYWDTYSVPLKDDAGEITGCIQVARNITEQVMAIQALETSEAKIHTLTQELIKAQENERHRIACHLHDHVAQDLSSLKIGLETLCDDRRESNPELREKIAGLAKLLQGSIAAVRDLSYDLRPPGIDQLGLNRAVFLYCEDFARQNDLKLDFYSAGLEDVRLDFDTEINLFRLIQEGLTNVKKHARAGQVAIRLVASCPNIILRIEDDGTGFDVQARLQRLIQEKRMGLSNMEERVRLLGGRMRIQSRPGGGTRLYIEVPFKERNRDPDSANHDCG